MNNWRGFIPNAHDTKIMSNYVDENFSNGLKQNSKRYLGYEQTSYDAVTSKTGPLKELPKGGRIINRDANNPDIVTKQYRMNELTAREVFAYGTDDTICTAALYDFYQLMMEIENTAHVYEQVEVKPAYLTALAFTQGCNVSIERLKEIEKEDDAEFDKARHTFERNLLEHGILNSMFEPMATLTAAGVKDACETLFGFRPVSQVRTMNKLAIMIREEFKAAGGDTTATVFAEFVAAVDRSDMAFINGLLLNQYRNNPSIDMGSPKQMKRFLYDILGLPVRVLNKLTPTERDKNKELTKAVMKFNKAAMKGEEPDLSEAEWELIKQKAKTDDTAVDFAVALDAQGHVAETLKAMQTMKTILTRRNFYYKPYPLQKHWKDGKIHASINQCATVTRRYSSSGPNLQQLPKKGDGVKIREMIRPHHKNAVIVSLDFSGQELRLAADMSRDENMLACYIGDRLKDIHSITASGAMEKKWGKEKLDEMIQLIKAEAPKTADDLYEIFVKLRKHEDHVIAKMADDLRKTAKNVNFGAQYDAQALTLSYQLIIPVADAQSFLDAKYKMFPKVETWKERVRKDVARTGYATTLLGARRHLARLLADRATQSKAERQGPNFKIQSSGAEMTKLAMARVWDSGVCFDYDCQFIAPIHDELVFSIDRNDVVEAVRIIHRCMTAQYADMIVPVMSSISIGLDFGNQVECNEKTGHFEEDTLRRELLELFKEDKTWKPDFMKEAA